MAIAVILLPPLGELDVTNPPGIRIQSATRQPIFDDTTPEIVRWKLRLPANFDSALILRGMVTMMGANTGTKAVRLGCAVFAVDSAEAGDTESFDTENTADVTINNTAGTRVDFVVALTNDDSAAAGDEITIKFRRVADHANDDAVGDMAMPVVNLEYTVA